MSKISRIGRVVVRGARSHGVLAMLVGSVIVNAALATELRDARRTSDRRIAAGTDVPPIAGRTAAGDAVTLSYRGELPTVLYYFSPTCGWCERNWDNVRALMAATRGRFRVVGLSNANQAAAHLRARGVEIDLLTGFGEATVASYHLGGTPQTIVVGSDGRVARAWTGAYTGRLSSEIEAYFGVRLPGLISRPGGEAAAPR